MESLVMGQFWQGKKVLVTGHTGFKGSWLSLWLLHLGAQVAGLSLEPNTEPSLFEQLALSHDLKHHIGDIRDLNTVKNLVQDFQPDMVFHLAAQPLVRFSYHEPVLTWQTNVLGTVNVLESLKTLDKYCVGVMITTDKCYDNNEWIYGYRENDPLGGHDPYSSSKAGAEIAIASWAKSFFHQGKIRVASARAGNVIGGGDWAVDRIVPDVMRALGKGEPIPVRNPHATRPWQHVLEPLGGYLTLAQKLYQELVLGKSAIEGAFNFGPNLSSNRPVKDLVEEILKHWAGSWLDKSDANAPHEANLLNLVTDKAYHHLNWQPRWDFTQTIKQTVSWYHQAHQLSSNDTKSFQALTLGQIKSYQSLLNQN
ncbi:MAG: CDP-glucose 4,6-dehydratase [Cyanobacterium sp.]